MSFSFSCFSFIRSSRWWGSFYFVEYPSKADFGGLIFRALFSRGLAELKYLGMVKGSRKKADHVAKLLWKGL